MLLKLCTKCNIQKYCIDFNKDSKSKDGFQYWCRQCTSVSNRLYRLKNKDILKNKEKEWRLKNFIKEQESSKFYRKLNPEKCLYSRTKSRAKKNNIPFNLTLEDIIIPKVCPVLGIPLIFDSKVTDNSPSIDKIIPELGYVKGNICIISLRANRIKSDSKVDEIEKILAYMKEENS